MLDAPSCADMRSWVTVRGRIWLQPASPSTRQSPFARGWVHITEDEARAYRVADNKIAESGGWDRDLLPLEVRHPLEVDFHLRG